MSQITESVRSLLSGDLEEYPQRTEDLDEQGWNTFGELVGAAFQHAVQRRFRAGADLAEITGFVAEARQPYVGTPVDVDEPSAVALVRSALGDDAEVAPVLERFDEPDLARIELLLLRRLLADADLTGAALDEFLSETGSAARPWTGEDADRGDDGTDADPEEGVEESAEGRQERAEA